MKSTRSWTTGFFCLLFKRGKPPWVGTLASRSSKQVNGIRNQPPGTRKTGIAVPVAVVYGNPTHGALFPTVFMLTPPEWSRNDSPKFRKRLVPIHTVGATEQLTATIISHSIWGIDTHWTRSGTRPHVVGHNLCQGCLDLAPLKWRGFLHIFHEAKKQEVFLELTDFAWRRMLALKGDFTSFRGLKFLFVRERSTLKAPVTMSLINPVPVAGGLPAEKDPTETLMRVWGFVYTSGQGNGSPVN